MRKADAIEISLIMFLVIFIIGATAIASYSVSKQAKLGNKLSYLPNSQLTPGAINLLINQGNIDQNICKKGWSTSSERPSSNYTTDLKKKQLAGKYNGYTDMKSGDYEEDHLISLELGGDPTDPKNLWPEPYAEPFGAKDKDKVENYLHAQVCNGSITLQKAQQEVVTNWVVVYQQINGKLGGEISNDDPDDE